MKKIFFLLVSIFSAQVFAAVTTVEFDGADSAGKPCSLQLFVDDSVASAQFSYTKSDGSGDGYGFSPTVDLKRQLESKQNHLEISEGGAGGAKLKVQLLEDGTVQAKYRNFVIISAECRHMRKTPTESFSYSK